ncbi:hypothetical protein V3481_013262 [Fusarium oxysporum f. sp. vasinfectum]
MDDNNNNQVKHHRFPINSSIFPIAAEVDAAGRVEAPNLDTLLDDVDVSSPDRRRLRPSTAHFSCLPPHGGPVNGFVFGPSLSACFFFSVEAFNRARHFIFSVPVHRAHY